MDVVGVDIDLFLEEFGKISFEAVDNADLEVRHKIEWMADTVVVAVVLESAVKEVDNFEVVEVGIVAVLEVDNAVEEDNIVVLAVEVVDMVVVAVDVVDIVAVAQVADIVAVVVEEVEAGIVVEVADTVVVAVVVVVSEGEEVDIAAVVVEGALASLAVLE